MEALQQGVMKLSRDPSSLTDARLERHVELMTQLPDTQLVARPQQRQKHSRARQCETTSCPTMEGESPGAG